MNWYKKQLKIAMPAPTKWEQKDLEAIKELFDEGYSINQVADVTGVSYGSIKKLNDKYQWIPIDRESRDRKKDEEIAKMYLPHPYGEGMSALDITRKIHVNHNRIKKALDRLGMSDKWRDRKTMWNDEMRQQQRDNANRQWEDPEFRNHVLENLNHPDVKQSLLEYHNSPEARSIYESPKYRERMRQNALSNWEKNFPGGWEQFINRYPPEKQREIERAMHANNPLLTTASTNWYKKAQQLNKIAINAVQFVRKLKDFNVIQDNKKLINLNNNMTTTVHNYHRGKDIRTGILERMLKDLGINPRDFYNNNYDIYKQKITKEIESPEEYYENSWQNQPWYIEQQKQLQK